MKTMRIGSSIINLNSMYDINCEECDEGTIVRVEYPHADREYLVPDFFVPEIVAAAIQRGLNGEGGSLDSFDLMAKLRALDRIYGGVRVDETKIEV
jgi:hypothetical protein